LEWDMARQPPSLNTGHNMPGSSMFVGRHEESEDSTRTVYVILLYIQRKRDKAAEEVRFKRADIWKSLKRMILDLPEARAQN
jgi:hypothetical protein